MITMAGNFLWIFTINIELVRQSDRILGVFFILKFSYSLLE